jgi:hypothetical protein
VLAVEAHLLAAVQQPDQLHGLLQHLQPHPDRRPRVAEDVLVEGFAAAHAEGEAAFELHGRGRRGLGDYRRVDAGVHPCARWVTTPADDHGSASSSAAVARRSPIGTALPVVVSSRVWRSDSALISAPSRTM